MSADGPAELPETSLPDAASHAFAKSVPTLPYAVPTQTGRLKLVAWGCVAAAGVSALVMVSPGAQLALTFLGLVGTLSFGAAGAWLLLSLPIFKSAFTATEKGLTVHSRQGEIGPIGWQEIRAFTISRTKVKFLRVRAIVVELVDPDLTLSRFDGVSRGDGFGGDKLDSAALGVPAYVIDAPVSDVLANLNALLAQRGGGRGG